MLNWLNKFKNILLKMIVELQQVTSLATNIVNDSNLSKQVLVSITTGLLCMCGGFTFGYSAVLIPKVKDDPDFEYNDYYDSWISSSAPLSMAFGCLIAGILLDKFGRKYTNILMLWPFLIGYLLLAFTKNVTYLLFGRFLTGMSTGVYRSSGSIYMVEVSDPIHRPLFQYILSLSSTTGILISHIIGKYLSPRISCLVFSTPIFIAFILIIFMKESPLWLISKGKLEEGIESFKWYRCKSDTSEKELLDVLENQKNKVDDLSLKDTIKIIFSKIFIKAYCTGFFLFAIVQFCGLNNLIFYAQDLLQPTFSGEIDAYLLMIIIDSLRLVGNVILIPVIKYCPKRKTFFIVTSLVIIILTGIIIFLIVKPVGLTWLLLTFLVIFMLIGGVVISLSWNFVSEIFPNEIRGIGLGTCATTSYLLLFVCVKLTPGIMENFGVIAVYSTFAGVTLISMIVLLFLLPETDGKTLQEIENSYNK